MKRKIQLLHYFCLNWLFYSRNDGIRLFATVTKIEQSVAKNPRIETLKQIADAFEVPLDELVGRKIQNNRLNNKGKR